MSEQLNMIITLTVICMIAAVALALTYQVTEPIIEDRKIAGIKTQLQEVLPSAEQFEEKTIQNQDVYIGKKKQQPIGVIIKKETTGYNGKITMLIAYDKEGTILAMRILEQTETPGLGTMVAEKGFLTQFIGKKNNDKFDTITGATISSSAVIRTVNEDIKPILEGIKWG